MPRQASRSERLPPGICDACGKPCGELHQVGIRCYHCFEGAFVPAALFYFMELDGHAYAIPLPEITEPPAAAVAVNMADPPAAELRARFERWERRFESHA